MGPYRAEVWADIEYGRKYGEEKLMTDLVKYEEITGKDWLEALLAFDSVSQSIEKFHKKVVLPFLHTEVPA